MQTARATFVLVAAALLAMSCGGSDPGDTAVGADIAAQSDPTPTTEVGAPSTGESSAGSSGDTEPDAPAPRTQLSPTATVVPTTPPLPPPEQGSPEEPDPTVPPDSTVPPEPTTVPPDPVPTQMPEAPSYECALEQNAPGAVSDLGLDVQVVADGLEVPWGLAILPNGDLLVTERAGRLRLIEQGQLVPEPVLEPQVELPPPLFGIDTLGPEGGLLGVLLHPDFDDNRQFYVFYNLRPEPDRYSGKIDRYVLADDGRSATLDRTIIEDLPAGVHHQGGRMHIGPDGMLYVGVGAFDPFEAQDPNSLAGKLLRMDLDGGVPSDNPDPDSYVFISGIRNSQGFDWFDDDTLVLVDHGPSGLELDMPELRGFDEVNVARAGDNLGWPRVWGCDGADGTLEPLLTWPVSVPPTGGAFYRNAEIPELTGRFLFTTVGRDFGQHLHSVELDPNDPYRLVSHEAHLVGAHGRLRTVVPDGAGGFYMMTSNCDGRGICPAGGDLVLRVTAANGSG